MQKRATREQAGLPRTHQSPTKARFEDPEVLSTLRPGVLTHRQITALQRTVGNHAISSILRSARQNQGMAVQRWTWVSGSQVDHL